MSATSAATPGSPPSTRRRLLTAMHESVPASDSEIAALREENTIRTRTGFARLLPLMALTGLAAGAIALLANAPHRRLPLVPVIREPLDRASAAHPSWEPMDLSGATVRQVTL